MIAIFILITLCAGVASAFQSDTNQALQKALNAPFWTAALASCVTFMTSLAVVSNSGKKLPSATAGAAASWWAWTVSVLGVSFVLASSMPRRS